MESQDACILIGIVIIVLGLAIGMYNNMVTQHNWDIIDAGRMCVSLRGF